MKRIICGGIGAIGGLIVNLLGGWDISMQALVLFMIVDYVSGLAVAGIFKNSPKSKNGALESKAGFKGLCRKGMTLLFVLIANYCDLVLGLNYIRGAVIIGFLANELISIIENAGLMGINLPEPIVKAVDLLNSKGEEGKNG